MTYEIGGRQYIALTITTETLPELIALAVPEDLAPAPTSAPPP
jgi:hypothetical protein